MNRQENWFTQKVEVWAEFWFPSPALGNLALMRIGVAIVGLYVLSTRAYDLEFMLSPLLLGDGEALQPLGRLTLPGGVFGWFSGTGWLWAAHVMAIVTAAAFLLGVYTFATGTVLILFLLSYGAQNPAVILGVDGLLVMSVFYLTISPSDRGLTALWWRVPVPAARQRVPLTLTTLDSQPPPRPWGGIGLRVLQIHLCILYFQSALGKMSQGWLQGSVFHHPRLVEAQMGLAPAMGAADAWVGIALAYMMVLFELFYGLLIWLPGFRWVVLGMAVGIHLWVGFAWDKLPFNLLMVFLNLAFLPPKPVDWFVDQIHLLGAELVAMARAAR